MAGQTHEPTPAPGPLILVTGATGYVGRHVVPHVVRQGFRVRALVRPGSDRSAVAAHAAEFFSGDVTDAATLKGACAGCLGVVHLVGVVHEKEGSFEAIHVQGTRHVLAEALRAGVRRFVYLSGLGARRDGLAQYHQTKYVAEESVRTAGLEGYCFPASVIFGPEDEFLNLFVAMAQSWVNPPWPIMPAIAGGTSYLQPVWVEDVAECLARALRPDFPLPPGSYELGGPEALTLKEIMRVACKAARRERVFVHVPLSVARILAWVMETCSSKPPLTRDQLVMLQEDGRAKDNATARILGRPPQRLWEYACAHFGLPYTSAPVVGGASWLNPVRPQEAIAWRPAPPVQAAPAKPAASPAPAAPKPA